MSNFKPSDRVYAQEVNEDAIKKAVEAVEDNNQINDGEWSDWDDADHVAETYSVDYAGDHPGLASETAAVINRAIRTNGQSLNDDLPAISRSFQGQVFSGSFWDRKENT